MKKISCSLTSMFFLINSGVIVNACNAKLFDPDAPNIKVSNIELNKNKLSETSTIEVPEYLDGITLTATEDQNVPNTAYKLKLEKQPTKNNLIVSFTVEIDKDNLPDNDYEEVYRVSYGEYVANFLIRFIV
ncbi:hypothetical protein [Spiroplasma apis]|uniref:Lipoprotein n=1 Tax=Spiroplasma apis B31 TaxID=1276258 RepID=V5RKX6_SPIAP|nr:hypothetical protein [Spiroplasma apis]AHB36465.1 hypothetical protein SAPIS_v1c06200 [Spiroplasma apis B31]